MRSKTGIFLLALLMLSIGYASASSYSLLGTDNEVVARDSKTVYLTGLSDIQWSNESIYHPENGDRIVEFNESTVIDEMDFRQKVANAGTYAIMKIVDHRSGTFYYLRTSILPPGSPSRLGIFIADSQQGGVVVTGVVPNSPGFQCQKNVGFINNNNSGNTNSNVYETWSAPIYHPENGDRIISFNQMGVNNQADFSQKVANSGPFARLKLIDHRTGRTYELRTQLNPPGSFTRLGIYIQDSPQGGVVVVGVIENSPGMRCQMLTSHNY